MNIAVGSPMFAAEAPQTRRFPINAENAVALAKLSHESRRKAKLLRLNPPIAPLNSQQFEQADKDPLAADLSRVQSELVQKMLGNDDPKAVSALAMALKNVRETFHLVTGLDKPGVRKGGQVKARRESSAAPVESPDE